MTGCIVYRYFRHCPKPVACTCNAPDRLWKDAPPHPRESAPCGALVLHAYAAGQPSPVPKFLRLKLQGSQIALFPWPGKRHRWRTNSGPADSCEKPQTVSYRQGPDPDGYAGKAPAHSLPWQDPFPQARPSPHRATLRPWKNGFVGPAPGTAPPAYLLPRELPGEYLEAAE